MKNRQRENPGQEAPPALLYRDAGAESKGGAAGDIQVGFVPTSWDPAKRTIDLVLSTGADVLRVDYWTEKRWIERLAITPEAVNLERLNRGAPLLWRHSSYAPADVLGKFVEGSARVEGGAVLATAKLTRAASKQETIDEIVDGTLPNVSIGYRIDAESVEAPTAAGGIEIRTATKFTIYEGSIVPIPADIGAGTRADPGVSPMKPKTAPVENPEDQGDATREAPATASSSTPAPAPAADLGAERQRVVDVIGVCLRAGIDAGPYIASGASVEAVRSAAFEALANRSAATAPRAATAATSTINVDESNQQKRFAGMELALLSRGLPELRSKEGKRLFELDDAARPYAGMSLLRLAEEFLRERGQPIPNGPGAIASAALALRSIGPAHSSSDFPMLLANTAGKALRAGYAELPSTYQQFMRRGSAPNFKDQTSLQLGNFSTFREVPESGEIKRVTLAEGKEVWRVKDYAEIFAITRKTIVNDDLGAFTQVPMKFARAGRRTENKLAYRQLLDNAALNDGVALFHATHRNLAAGADVGALSLTTLAAARLAMAKQYGLGGTADKLNLKPRFLIYGSAYLNAVDQLMTQITPAQTSNAVPAWIKGLIPIHDAELDDYNGGLGWYLATDPGDCDTLVYGYLAGEEGLTTETKMGFEVDGVEIKARLAFGAGVDDFRGLYKNPGA